MTKESSEKRSEESHPPEIDKNKNGGKLDAKSKFFRRFRLTRSKSRQAADQKKDQDHPRIRRSNSLTQLPEPKYSVQDWLIKRRAVADEELYVGNTLMKQKQRLWVRTGNSENRDKSCSLPAGNRMPETSDIEQILCRAARIRRRRDRSRSNDPLKKSECLQSSTNQITADSESENYGSSNTLHSSTQISEDSFILSKKWRMHLNPEAGSISTDYDPNSSTIGESQSASSGYWSRGEKEEDNINQKAAEKTPLDLDLEQIRPESLRLPEQTHVHRTQHEQISQNQLASRKDEGYFYVALVGDNSNADEQASRKSSLNSSYRVHSGYCESEEAEVAERRRRTRECYAKLQQRRQSNDSLSSSCIVQSRPLRSSSMPKKSSPKIQSDDVKVEKMEDKDEWKITIKISCSQNGNDKNAEQLNSSSTEKCVPSVDSSTATVTQKHETQTQTSRCESPARSESPLVVKWETPASAPIIKTSKDVFSPGSNDQETSRKQNYTRPKITTVLPTLPTRPRFLTKIAPPALAPVASSPPSIASSRYQRKRTDFKSVLNQWQERASLSRSQSFDQMPQESQEASSSLTRNFSKRAEAPSEKSPITRLAPISSSFSPSRPIGRCSSNTALYRSSYRPGIPTGWRQPH